MSKVLNVVDQSNQRGGRMLSIIDLLEAGTLSLEQCAVLLARIESGSSWLVGAKPGGAGKTTIMSALLAMLPEGEDIRVTTPNSSWEQSNPGDCVVCYEISSGYYHGYIWGEDIRKMTELGLAGCRIVSNLHADTIEQARSQIAGDCGATEAGFGAFDLFLPISFSGGWFSPKRQVKNIYEFTGGEWRKLTIKTLTSRELAIIEFIRQATVKGLRTCPEVRRTWLALD